MHRVFRNLGLCALAVMTWDIPAAERRFDFSEFHENETPAGFRSAVTGEGKPGDWRVIMDEVPPLLPPLTPQAPVVTKKAVLAQLSQDPTDEHFPLLIFEADTFSDFTLTTRFKTVRGDKERMAGIAFRIQDEKNYYVLRASSLGNTFRFYKVVNGERGEIIGPELPIPSGVWHEMGVECRGNQIRCRLDGKDAIPPLTDSTFIRGKVGFWTKSDSVSYFCDTKVTYTPREMPAQVLLRRTANKYPRLLALKIYVPGAATNTTRVIASKNEADIGQPGSKTEEGVIGQNQIWYGTEKTSVSIITPLLDRNGDPIAALRIVMKPFTGQSEQHAFSRAMPIIKEIQKQVTSLQDLTD